MVVIPKRTLDSSVKSSDLDNKTSKSLICVYGEEKLNDLDALIYSHGISRLSDHEERNKIVLSFLDTED